MTSSPPASAPPRPRSCLYDCRVLHHRLAPRRHRFEYGLFLLCVDLDELPALDRTLRLLGWNRPNLYEFRDSDHLPPPGESRQEFPGDLRRSLRDWLAADGFPVPADARILLITLPRVAGYLFNPVSFYFVQSRDGTPLCAVAEVGNTFGELKPYRVPVTAGGGCRFRRVVPKHFYVSPFSPLDLCFDFRLQEPGDRLELVINDVTADGRRVLVSTLSGRRRPLTDGQLVRLTARYPLVTLRVITLIHWQAFRLWLRRLPWFRKGDRPEDQRGVLRPHPTVQGPRSSPVPPKPMSAASSPIS
ncbi:MAG: DUF1365 domain-containing protein [Verrucomicrobia bacterium]|nr:DUF1365 domain-containing protein [Verrucomicrobiota bacterium]